MLALESAVHLSCRINLLHEPILDSDVQVVSEMLEQRSAGARCPGTPRRAVPTAVEAAIRGANGRRSDPLLALWMEARDELAHRATAEQRLWATQASRRVLPRGAVEALLGVDRDATLRLIACNEVIDAAQLARDAGLSDNHLHSGAADELGDVLERLVRRVVSHDEPRELRDVVGIADGVSLNAGPLVLALAASCVLLNAGTGPRTTAVRRLSSLAWWRRVARSARDAGTIDGAAFNVLRSNIRQVSDEQCETPQVKTLYAALTEIARGGAVTAARAEAARRGLVALATLHALVTVPQRSSLSTFVKRFRLLRGLRGLFGADEGRISSALRTMYLDVGVTAVELRKSIAAHSGRTVSVERIVSSIKTDLEHHARGAEVACRALGTNLVVRMPLTFTRRESNPADGIAEEQGYVPYRSSVAETLAVADAIIQVTAAPSVRRFVGAVDVVGDEKRVPNWLYAIAYGRIAAAKRPGLEFAAHAGEYFADRIEGLRRVAEVSLFAPAHVRRIGHCLALETHEGPESENAEEAGTLLENVIWSLLVLSGSADVGLGQTGPVPDVPLRLLRDLERVAVQLASTIFGGDVSLEDVSAWYVHRFDLEQVGRWIPEVREPPTPTTIWARGTTRAMLQQPIDVIDGMLATTVLDMPVEVPTPAGPQRIRFQPSVRLRVGLADQTRALLDQVCPHVVEPVRRWLTANRIVIESCPSSNAALGRIAITEHPIWPFHRDELLCSVNTDDPALFGASLAEEYVHAGMAAHGDVGPADAARFVTALADTSRSAGMIVEPLCEPHEVPVDVYRALESIRSDVEQV